MSANELRGEVDLVLDGEAFVLRPSYTAIIEVEKLTGKSLIDLTTKAGDGELSLTDTAIVVAEFIKAWKRSQGDAMADAIKAVRIGELIHEFGLMQAQLRLAIVLAWAVTGGCKADGTRKDDDDEGEAKAAGTTGATSAAASRESPAPRSAGRRGNSGKRRR